MSAVHVRTVIEHMKRNYPVDEDRVYLVGFSAGASGAMQVASTHADQFAAVLPLVAVGTDYPISNFRNLPVAQHHGTADWVSSICNARGQHRRMLNAGCPAQLIEYENVGHSVPRPHEPIVDWMLSQKRERSPKLVMHECEAVSLSRAYGIRVERFEDPHRRAKILVAREDGEVRIEIDNVGVFSIEPDALAGGDVGHVVINGRQQSMDGVGGKFSFWRTPNGYQWVPFEAAAEARTDGERSIRSYEAGGAANLYQGEPLLVVYGTANGQEKKVGGGSEKTGCLWRAAFGSDDTVVSNGG